MILYEGWLVRCIWLKHTCLQVFVHHRYTRPRLFIEGMSHSYMSPFAKKTVALYNLPASNSMRADIVEDVYITGSRLYAYAAAGHVSREDGFVSEICLFVVAACFL